MNYPHNIPSIAELHPAFAADPNVCNARVMQGIYASKVAGTPIDFQAVQDAEHTLEVLLWVRESLPVITDKIIETARNRIHAIKQTHASLEFSVQPAVGQQLADFDQRLARIDTYGANTRIMSRNWRDPSSLRPLKKYIEGDGHELARAIHGHAVLPDAALEYQPHAAVGAVPDDWNSQIDAYQDVDILKLIIYYNDDIGIVVGDSLDVRKQKVHNWLVGE